MIDLKISKANEAYIKIEAEPSTLMELSEDFTFYSPNYQYHPLFKKRVWDGKIKLFDQRNKLIYSGLKHKVVEWAEKKGYSHDVEWPCNALNPLAIRKWVDDKNNSLIKARDYQFDIFFRCLHGNATVESPTGSGKSLMIYLLSKFYNQKTLIICPTTNLVEQMYNDFGSYGDNGDCLKVWAGIDPQTDKRVVISTWQSLMDMEPEYFEQFSVVIGDEAHGFKAKSLVHIMTRLVNARHRFGFTGTLSNDIAVHELVLEGLFGPIIHGETTEELIEQKYLADLNVVVIVLEYPEADRKLVKGMEYNDEVDFVVDHVARQRYVKNLVLSLKGSTFALCRLIDKHAKLLYEEILPKKGVEKCKLVYGGTNIEDRESTRLLATLSEETTVVASYGVFSGGVNVPNLKNIVFASPYKSKIKVLQSIGRALRRTDTKNQATIYDIVDDLASENYKNYSIQHFFDRYKIYNKVFLKQNIKIIRVQLKEPDGQSKKLCE